MLTPYLAIVATLGLIVGITFALPKVVRRIPPNKVYLFVFWFVLGVLFNLALDYLFVAMLGVHKTSWTRMLVISFFLAVVGTLLPPQRSEQQSN
jgi:hypothetical protein